MDADVTFLGPAAAGDETRVPPPAPPATGPGAAAAAPDAYTAGTLLAQRYRIVGLLGRGGMGEVYRADDLTLGHPVALKFLPRTLEGNASRLTGFLEEVRSARQVSHPNVCRVYDVGDADGRRFLTMEYVDGEDLGTSLRRIGRFPIDKGLEIARQLCAGLAAVHDRGLLHRDLKPANVMLDGRGKVRLTDFGLAGDAAPAAAGTGQFAGTPAYMAPELLRGEPATVQSDIYALGLVLYEVLTGKRAFDAGTIVELRQQQEQSRPASLSSSAGQVDPAVEELIFRCLDPDPARRPGSAIVVAAALPGGDPLAAALAAGETPSPAMVAAAGENQGLQPRAAVTLLASFFGLLAVVAVMLAYDGFTRYVPLEYPPAVLANKADEISRSFGWPEKTADAARLLYWDFAYLQFVNQERREPDRWAAMRNGDEPGVAFFYRTSERPLVARGFGGASMGNGRVGTSDPPPLLAGERRLWLDTKGQLNRFEAVTPQIGDTPAAAAPAADWSRVFAAAGLDPSWFTPAEPTWLPLAMADARAAWTGARPNRPSVPLRIEAAAWRGRIVFARVIGPWTRPERQQARAQSTGDKARTIVGISIIALLTAGASLLARYNLRQARADRRGAGRLGWFVFVLMLTGWALQTDHVANADEISLLVMGVSMALFSAGAVWLLYVALEPFVRRRWPHTIITWNRLLAGRVADGLVGRDVLIGSVLGLALAAAFFGALALGRLVGPVDPEPVTPSLDPLLGARFVGSAFVGLLYNSIMGTLTVFSVIFILLLLLRRVWITALVFVLLATSQAVLGSSAPVVSGVYSLLAMGGLVFVLFRFGLVAFAVGNFVLSTLGGGFPLSVDPSQWYTGPSLVVFGGLAAAAIWGFRRSLGGQKVFGTALE